MVANADIAATDARLKKDFLNFGQSISINSKIPKNIQINIPVIGNSGFIMPPYHGRTLISKTVISPVRHNDTITSFTQNPNSLISLKNTSPYMILKTIRQKKEITAKLIPIKIISGIKFSYKVFAIVKEITTPIKIDIVIIITISASEKTSCASTLYEYFLHFT